MGMTGSKVQMDSKALPSFEVTLTVRLSDQSWCALVLGPRYSPAFRLYSR
jgi:hypothetical protein